MQKTTTFRILCAMARVDFSDRTIDDSEWADRIKRRLVRQAFTLPRPHEITAAMRAVERALAKIGPHETRASGGDASTHRPNPGAVVRARPRTADRPTDPALTREEAAVALRRILARTKKAHVVKRIPRARLVGRRAVDCHRAAQLLAHAIVEQVQRCDEAERAAAAAVLEPPEASA